MKNHIGRALLSVIFFLFSTHLVNARMGGSVETSHLEVDTAYGPYRFEIHLPDYEENFRNRVLSILEKNTAKLADYFKYAPSALIHITLKEGVQEANGSATVFPFNHIVLRKFPPLGRDHLISSPNSLGQLIIHELVHIIHMDQTRGVLKLSKGIFGTFGKWGGIAPRWFIEGIATWAESALTDSGRLRSELLKVEWEQAFKDANFCQTIDCLDDPGTPPYGQYAYWTGAFFMEFLESKSKNSVQCLIFANSNNIPFFLNSAFKECFNKSAGQLYDEFREDFLKKYRQREIDEKEFVKIKYFFSRKSLQEGFALVDNKLLSVEFKNDVKVLLEQPLDSSKVKEIKLSERLSRIYKNSSSSASIVTFPNIRNNSKRNHSFYEKGFISKNKRLGEFFYGLNDSTWVFEFNKGRWVINNGEFTFPEEISLSYFKGAGEFVYFKLFDARKEVSYFARYNTVKKRVELQREVASDFKILDNCREDLILRESGQLYKMSEGRIAKVVGEKSQIIIEGSFEKNQSVVVLKDSPNSLYKWSKGCDDLRGDQKLSKRVNFKEVDLERESLEEITTKRSSYPGFRHFLPTHWMINYVQSTDELSYWSALSIITDPDSRHTLSLKGLFYTGISEVTPELSYTYQFPNDFFLSLNHSKAYTSSSQRRSYDSNQSNSIYFSKFFELGNFDLKTSLYAGHFEVDDFISSRDEKEYGTIIKVKHVKVRDDDFLSKALLKARLFKREVEGTSNYNGMQSIAEVEFRLLSDLNFSTDIGYSSLDKRDFRSGVIYGGGSYTEYHQFYGLGYSDIFGNEVKSMRLHFDYSLFDIYRGAGLFPLFVQELHLLAGTDFIAADRIFLVNQYLRNSSVQSYWAGVRADFTVAYALPISIDIIRSQVLNRFGQDKDSTISVIRGSFSF
ncbi:putative membrane protein [Halobacteriovorax marinus SJ]|uniref:Membrane protein n=2 Tax=Halobacteriovorax marinus TaxID=97084 RepID=E1X5R7_HALMS|nr:putative membrane protein [Halobacteriovorax marinus SJ]